MEQQFQLKKGQRVRIKEGSGIQYGFLGNKESMKSADGLEGELVEYQDIPQHFGGSRWVFKADSGKTFQLRVEDIEI